MDAWWIKGEPALKASDPITRAVAYYRHSAQDRQENSIPLQREQVQLWAAGHGILIIQEFADHGKSGLSVDHRDAFNDMLENWVKKRDDFRYILVLDVSRWGRFQDIDLSATYSAQCTQSGKKVVYTTLGLPEKDDPLHAILVGFERYRAAQYSRELSEKVFRGSARIIGQGFRSGGYAPYGFSRILLDEKRLPVQILKRAERKAIQNQRVTLAPGDLREIAIVRRIFDEWVHGGVPPKKIARRLNDEGVPSPSGRDWDSIKVRRILKNELYIGTLIYNKTSNSLVKGCKVNPKEQWIRVPAAFSGIITPGVFERAQALLAQERLRPLPEAKLEMLGTLYQRCGTLTRSLIDSNRVPLYSDSDPSPVAFRTIGSAFQRLFPALQESVSRKVRSDLERLVGGVEEHEDFLVLDRRLTLVVQPSIPIPCGLRSYWPIIPDSRTQIDLTLGVLLSGAPDGKTLGYLALPRLLISPRPFRLYGARDWRIAIYGHKDLSFIPNLLACGGTYGPQSPASHEGPSLRAASGGPDRGAELPGSGGTPVRG